ncbi:MAG: helix-turn-helix domain-containing protein, partial [Bacillota bacterium]|nr:helix-turn-helix domain-containing protein [Bacillota bacterium]
VVPIKIPPLRERREDIAPLLIHYVNEFNKKYKMSKQLTGETVELLEQYDWPGNVRELVNLVERIMVVSGEDELTPKQLPKQLLKQLNKGSLHWEFGSTNVDIPRGKSDILAQSVLRALDNGTGLEGALELVEKELIRQKINNTRDYKEAADQLQISIATLNRRIEKFKLRRKDFKYQ